MKAIIFRLVESACWSLSFSTSFNFRVIVSREASRPVLLTKHYSGELIEKNEMGGARSMHAEEDSWIEGFGAET
jgi:hypothetical protein